MKPNKIFFIFLFISLLSCRHNLVQPKDFTIVSPVVGNVYYDDIPTACAIDKNITSVSWSSSLDGNLGTGAQISCRLSAGTHIITARDVHRGTSASVSIIVTERNNIEKNGTRFLLPYLPYTCVIKNNQYKPYIVSLDGSASDLTCITELLPKARYSNNVDNNITAKANGLNNNEDDLNDVEDELKLFRCTGSGDMQKLQVVSHPRIFKRNTVSPLQDENERSFLIVNTAFQSGQPHNILFKRYYTSDTITVWLPKEYAADTAAIDACIAEFENTIYIRVTEIWGTAADIDYNQKFTIVFSPTINDEKRALGFFNPADFFKRNNDTSSENYNPASNEGDIIYAAMPSSIPNDQYFYKSIAATIGHELTHAVTFTKKTYNRIKAGDTQAKRAEIFLDEGISHLSENLMGYGISGGNIKFFQVFLSNTLGYSFCKNSAAGLDDSVGQRGAMTLFLSWCFWQKGGMTWDSQASVHVKDAGGIAFLQKLISSPYTGWEAIGEAFGTPTDMLFLQMLSDLRQRCPTTGFLPYKQDPLTGEAVEFLPCMGKINGVVDRHGNELIIGLPHPLLNRNGTIARLLPYSFVFYRTEDFYFDEVPFGNPINCTFTGTELLGRVFFCITKK